MNEYRAENHKSSIEILMELYNWYWYFRFRAMDIEKEKKEMGGD